MRYVGQNFELRVSVGTADGVETGPGVPDVTTLRRLFFDVHERNYGFFNPDDPVEVVNIRLTARGELPKPHPADATH